MRFCVYKMLFWNKSMIYICKCLAVYLSYQVGQGKESWVEKFYKPWTKAPQCGGRDRVWNTFYKNSGNNL